MVLNIFHYFLYEARFGGYLNLRNWEILALFQNRMGGFKIEKAEIYNKI